MAEAVTTFQHGGLEYHLTTVLNAPFAYEARVVRQPAMSLKYQVRDMRNQANFLQQLRHCGRTMHVLCMASGSRSGCHVHLI